MKISNIILTCLLMVVLCACGNNSQNNGEANHGNNVAPANDKPVNISIFLDLSDRIIKTSNGMVQHEKDSVIVEYIVSYFQEVIRTHKIQNSNDKIKVYFYPTPSLPEINNISKKLDVDFSKLEKGVVKKKQAQEIIQQFNENLSLIYQSTLQTKNWIGSDIWFFFEDRVKDLCVKKDYRNILIILSDGYIFHVDNKQKQGNNYSYITTQTLSVKDSGLIPCSHSNLSDLEVLFLEVDAPINHSKRINEIISDWFNHMSIKKYQIVKTDQPTNTTQIIENFLAE